jgi:adenylylsulfate kinase
MDGVQDRRARSIIPVDEGKEYGFSGTFSPISDLAFNQLLSLNEKGCRQPQPGAGQPESNFLWEVFMFEHGGNIIWLTGLPASGKTTIANALYQRLTAGGAKVQVLDGDIIRAMTCGTIGYTKEERAKHVLQVANTAKMLADHGIIAIIAVIAPYRDIRDAVLKRVGALEIFVDSPIEVCQARDPKGLYARALRGEIHNFTGVNDPYDPPLAPDLHLHTDQESLEESCERLFDFLCYRGIVDDEYEYFARVTQPYFFERVFSYYPLGSLLLFKKMGFTRKAAAAFWNDSLQFLRLRRYSYKRKVLFVAGLPKSGTTWMSKLLGMIPGYHERAVYDPSRLIQFHDISPMVFQLMPNYSYSIIKSHTKYSPENFSVIRSHLDKFIVMYRDLRDMAISRYFHVLNEDSHRHCRLYQQISQEDGILHSMNIVRRAYVSWVQDWRAMALAYPEAIIEVRYEEMHADVRGTMNRVLTFLDIHAGDRLLDRMADTQLRAPVDLKKSLARGDTKRKGIVGDWRNLFTEKHKDHFKEMAGQLLIDLGYEQDMNW